jgi:ribokinase
VRLARVHALRPSVAVVGHVEWVQFAQVQHVPAAGEVVHAQDPFEEPAGGGAVAAVQLARLAGACSLFTALGEDEHGRRSLGRLAELGVGVHAARLAAPTRRAITLLDAAGERTITTLGARLEPSGEARELGWEHLGERDGIYFTAGDLPALRAARAATRVLVASPRAREALGHGVPLDALVYSGRDPIERAAVESEHADAEARLLVITAGGQGGSYRTAEGERGEWRATPPPGPVGDSYGCGDSFAGGLTFALAAGIELREALALASRCGATCLTGRGPYARQLGAEEL